MVEKSKVKMVKNKFVYTVTLKNRSVHFKHSLKSLKIMETFTKRNLPGLTTTLLGALELFVRDGLPKTKIPVFKKPIIMGSGNAEVTAKILYNDSDAIFVNENNYKEAVKRKGVDGAIIFSASGEKHATITAKYFKLKKLKTVLVTCNKSSSAGKVVGVKNTIVTNKNREPYTYNTSTYIGWLFAVTKENPQKIIDFINDKVKKKIPKNIGNYNGYLLVTPDNFSIGNRLFEVKFIELFARKVARDVRTFEELRHAITVVPSEKELCIQFGDGVVNFDKKRLLKIPLPKNAGPATIMAIGYYVIGHISDAKPQWFKKNISKYIAGLNKTEFGKNLKVIVE